MSQSNTAQQTPQWQLELIAELRTLFDLSTVTNAFLAAIIARHAPQDVCISHSALDQSASEAKDAIRQLFETIDNLMSDRDNIRDRVIDKLAAKDARIAVLEQREKELEAENTRLRELIPEGNEGIYS